MRIDSSNPVPPIPAMIGWPNVIEEVDVTTAGTVMFGLCRIGPPLDLAERLVLNVASMSPRLGAVVGFAGAKLSVASEPPIKQSAKANKKRGLKRPDSWGWFCCI